jgi:copper chaperone CopZ
MATMTLKVEGLGATAATAHLEKAVEAVAKVDSVRMDTASGRVLVEHHGADQTELVNALKAVGYDEVRVDDRG